MKEVVELSRELRETSGLATAGGLLLTNQDRGNPNTLYAIDTLTGFVSRRFRISGAENIDWEDLTTSDSLVFIGDFGNNKGDRQDLAIHLLDRGCLSDPAHQECPVVGTISFRYPEQEQFEPGKEHNFDCEAMVFADGFLYLFTKHRMDEETVAYRLPAQPGHHDAERLGSFSFGGRVTGADLLSHPKRALALIGCSVRDECFVWLFNGFEGDDFFSGHSQRIDLGQYQGVGQTEAVLFEGPGSVLISSERIKHREARLYRLPIHLGPQD